MRVANADVASVNLNNVLPAGEPRAPQRSKDEYVERTSAKSISSLSEFERNELPISERMVIEAIERANKSILGGYRKFEFSIHEKTKEIMVKVIDADTNEVIREIPPEKILDMVAKMWEMAGIIVDERR
jgi:flagellar protein FlaG